MKHPFTGNSLATLLCIGACFFGALLFFIGCEVESEFEPINSGLILRFQETHMGDGAVRPSLQMTIETEHIYECSNRQIALQVDELDNQLRIVVNGVTGTDPCLSSLGPATSSFNVSENIEWMTITMDDQTDRYAISIDSLFVRTDTLETASFTYFETQRTFRYPEHTFAFLCGTEPNDYYVCQEFLAALKDSLPLTEFDFPQDGRAPYPARTEGYGFNPHATYLRYDRFLDLEGAGGLLKEYYEHNLQEKAGLGLTILGWDNTEFRNNRRIR